MEKMTLSRPFQIFLIISLGLIFSGRVVLNSTNPDLTPLVLTFLAVALIVFLRSKSTRLWFRVLFFVWLAIYLFCSFWFAFGWEWALQGDSGMPDGGPVWSLLIGLSGISYWVNFYAFFIYALILLMGMLGVIMHWSNSYFLCAIATFLIFWSSFLASLPAAVALSFFAPASPMQQDPAVAVLVWILCMAVSCSTWRAALRQARAENG
jgi:hypothetical protein